MSDLRVLHVTPHLGGGVGRCLSAICAVENNQIVREFLLLEEPIDKHFHDLISAKCKTNIIKYDEDLEQYLQSFDVIQCEFWNHPAMLHFLSFTKGFELRRVFWIHISGLGAIELPQEFIESDHEVIFTSDISNARYNSNNPVVNSGFGFSNNAVGSSSERIYDFIYAGQLDHKKLHGEFADIIDHAASLSKSELVILGSGQDKPNIEAQVQSENVKFLGHVNNVEEYFRRSKFLIYPLNESHYGTGENIIKEAMSAGCIPLLLSNPAELEIMKEHADTFCFSSAKSLKQALRLMLENSAETAKLSQTVEKFCRDNYSPHQSSEKLHIIYNNVMEDQRPESFNIELYFGNSPEDWRRAFSSQMIDEGKLPDETPSKGSRLHFEHYFSQGEELLGINYDA